MHCDANGDGTIIQTTIIDTFTVAITDTVHAFNYTMPKTYTNTQYTKLVYYHCCDHLAKRPRVPQTVLIFSLSRFP